MQVTSACPLRVASILWQPRPGAAALTVVCKATFTVQPGESPLAGTQDPVCTSDVPWEDGRGSLRAASDLVPFKRRVDVAVVGHAHAPRGTPATLLVARIAIAEMDKSIEVHGDGWWTPDGQLTAAVPFSRMPLRWERAAGGPGTWNPVGLPPGAATDTQGLRPAPNLLPVGASLQMQSALIPRSGLGPLAPTWPERVAKLRHHAGSWRHEAWAERPLPEDIDAAYFNAAPPDQQLDQLRRNERLVLEHLHPDHPHLVTVLEEVIPHAVVQRDGEAPQEIRLRCDTLVVDADRGTCTLTWRGVVPLRHPAEDGVVVVAAERVTSGEDTTTTLVPAAHAAAGRAGPALPFAPAAYAPAVAKAGDSDTLPGKLVPSEADDGTGTVAGPLILPGAAPLPFRPAQTVDAAQPATPAHVWEPPATVEPAPDASQAIPRRPTPPPPPLVGGAAITTREDERDERDERDEPTTARRPPGPAHPPTVATPEPSAPATHVSAAPSPPRQPDPEPAVRPEDVSVERFAAISAEIAEGRSPRPEVLRVHGLGEPTWAAVELHWQHVLEKDDARGGRLRATHNSAYVAAVERFRGPVTLPEYAHIAVGLERGQVKDALDALKIQRAALMPIMRTWTKRVATDPKQGGARLGVAGEADSGACRRSVVVRAGSRAAPVLRAHQRRPPGDGAPARRGAGASPREPEPLRRAGGRLHRGERGMDGAARAPALPARRPQGAHGAGRRAPS